MQGEKGMSNDGYTDATSDVEITKRTNVDGLNNAAMVHFKKKQKEEEE